MYIYICQVNNIARGGGGGGDTSFTFVAAHPSTFETNELASLTGIASPVEILLSLLLLFFSIWEFVERDAIIRLRLYTTRVLTPHLPNSHCATHPTMLLPPTLPNPAPPHYPIPPNLT